MQLLSCITSSFLDRLCPDFPKSWTTRAVNLVLKELPIFAHSARPWARADPVLNDMYLGLCKSVSATRGNIVFCQAWLAE